MNKEKLVKKWISDKLSEKEGKNFKKLPDYKLMVKIKNGAHLFKASYFSKVVKLDSILLQIKINKEHS